MSDEQFTELVAERIVIRRFRPSDAATFAAYRSDPAVARFQGWDTPYTLDQAEALIRSMDASHPDTPGEWFQFAVVSRADGALLGDCGTFVGADEPRQIEVGFTIASARQGRGYGTEALTRLLDYWFAGRGKHRAIATCDARNSSSMQALRRIGFRQEGRLMESFLDDGMWVDELVFGLLNREWSTPPSAPQ